MASFSEFVNSPSGKPIIGIIALIAVGIAGFEMMNSSSCKSNDYGTQVDAQKQISEAQKAIEGIKANQTMSPQAKQEALQHWQGEIDQAQGKNVKSGPPPQAGVH